MVSPARIYSAPCNKHIAPPTFSVSPIVRRQQTPLIFEIGERLDGVGKSATKGEGEETSVSYFNACVVRRFPVPVLPRRWVSETAVDGFRIGAGVFLRVLLGCGSPHTELIFGTRRPRAAVAGHDKAYLKQKSRWQSSSLEIVDFRFQNRSCGHLHFNDHRYFCISGVPYRMRSCRIHTLSFIWYSNRTKMFVLKSSVEILKLAPTILRRFLLFLAISSRPLLLDKNIRSSASKLLGSSRFLRTYSRFLWCLV